MESIILSLALSSHIGLGCCYNEVHPNIRYELSDNFAVGAYYNSEFRISPYAVYITDGNPYFEVGVVGGYSYGTVPMVKINYDIGNQTYFVAPGVAYTADMKIKVGAVAGIEFKF